ncbi:MAG: hypothetical protein IPM33_00050 [Phycisphaerales bacterium]|nr:hypothetical protein [Phycisphaerales bacterium]
MGIPAPFRIEFRHRSGSFGRSFSSAGAMKGRAAILTFRDTSRPLRRLWTTVSPPCSSALGAVLLANPTGPTTTESLARSYPKRINFRRLPSCECGGLPGGAVPLRLRMLVLAAVRMNAPAWLSTLRFAESIARMTTCRSKNMSLIRMVITGPGLPAAAG